MLDSVRGVLCVKSRLVCTFSGHRRGPSGEPRLRVEETRPVGLTEDKEYNDILTVSRR